MQMERTAQSSLDPSQGDTASDPAGFPKSVSIIGLGNIMKGDFGVGCYVVDALNQEPLGDSIDVSYLAEDSFYVDAYFYGMKFGIVVQAVDFGGQAGSIYCWDKRVFERNAAWFAEKSPSQTMLARALTRAELIEEFPDDLLFVWIEPRLTEGFGISPEMHKAIRKAVRIIKTSLFERNLLPEMVFSLSIIHQLKILDLKI